MPPPDRPPALVGVVPSPLGDARSHDGVLVVACVLALACILFLVFRPNTPPAPSGSLPPVIGKLTQQVRDVRRRSDGVLVWSNIRPGEEVRDGDGIYVGEGAAATVEMNDGAEITIDDKSLVILHPASQASAHQTALVDLLRGGAAGVARQSSVAFRTAGAAVQVEQGARALVRLRADRSLAVSVPQGSARIRLSDGAEAQVGAHQRRVVDRTSQHIGAAEVLGADLTEPAAAARVFLRPHADPVRFAWKPVPEARSYTLELSRDAEFTRVMSASTREPWMLQKLGAGVYYWRVWVQLAQARRVSEERSVVLVDDAPPVPYWPAAGQALDLSRQHRVALAWVAVPGVHHYKVQLQRDAQAPTEQRVNGASLLLAADDDSDAAAAWREGTYCYRVRADEADRGNSPWSEPSCFRVITKPVLKAPKLFDPSHPEQGALPPAPGACWAWVARLLGGVAQAAEEARPGTIVLRWEEIAGAVKYQVEVAQDAQFTRGTQQTQISSNAWRWQPPAFADYFWRVRAIDAEGRLGEVSDVRAIVLVGGPPEISGAEGTVLYGQSFPEVSLRWQGHGPSADVWVEVARDAGFAPGLRSDRVQDANHWGFRAAAPGAYHWRVVQRLEGGRRGPASPVHKFTLRPGAPEGLEPNAHAKAALQPNDTLLLHWSARAAVEGYEVELSPERGFKKAALLAAKKNSLSVPAPAPGTTYWRVRCRAPASDWSAAATWTVAAPVQLAADKADRADDGDGDEDGEDAEQGGAPAPAVAAAPDPWELPGVAWSNVYAGLGAAFYVNLGGGVAPRVALEGGWRTPWGPGELGAALSAGYYTLGTQALSSDQRVTLQARMHALPLDFTGVFVWPTRWVNITAAAGLRCVVNFNQVVVSTLNAASAAWSSTTMNVGGVVAGGAERPVGPGAAFAELSLAWTSRSVGWVQNDASGLAVALGYRIRVF